MGGFQPVLRGGDDPDQLCFDSLQPLLLWQKDLLSD